jgi:hypothetical protein
MFDSVKYNLTNPVFTEDIGEASLNRMFPSTNPNIYNDDMDFGNLSMQSPLDADKVEFQSKKKSHKKTWKTVLIIAGTIALGLLGFKYGKKVGSTIWSKIKSLGSTIKSKIKK